MSNDSAADLLARWREGDQLAAVELFRRYAEELVSLARRRLSDRLARHIDPEDVVQSVYRSFFSGARAGRFELHQGGDVWRLLVAITLHKLHRQVERFTAAKRSIDREQSLPQREWHGIPASVLVGNPSPLEAAALADGLENFMHRLEPVQRQILEMRLQGYNQEEIATQANRSERTVRRILDGLKAELSSADFLGPGW